MAHRYPYDRERWEQGRHGGYPDIDRGAGARAREDRDAWFGENDEIARQRRQDEEQRVDARARERWEATSAWGNPRSYSSDREYGDRGYAWSGEERARHTEYPRPSGWTEAEWMDRGSQWRAASATPGYSQMSHGHYAEPGYIATREYGPQRYGDPSRREWSSVEGWRVPGPHSGRGPRGYQRSDERIHDELNERLTAHGLIDASDVECRVVNGEVTLTGFVDSRAAKRAAEDLAEDIYGVRQVQNELRIRSHATDEGVGRTSVLGLTEAQMQRGHAPAAPAPGPERSRTRT